MSMSRRCKDGSMWGERIIRNGEIRWFGRTMRVQTRQKPDINGFQEPPYDGRLDGMVGLFYQYAPHPRVGGPNVDVYLQSFPVDRKREDDEDYLAPNVMEDGHIVWDHFVEERAKP